MDIFTSISLNYLPKARILATTVKNFHPDWKFHLLISDRESENTTAGKIDFTQEPFDRIVWAHELQIENIYAWIFSHSVVEICTAVKGPFLQQLVREGAKKIIYLDPDIAVFNSLKPLVDLLDNHAILLTPHLLDYSDDHQAISDNEIMGVMRHGIFNLGFFAVNSSRPEGQRFAKWWGDRLLHYCYADYDRGLFTDQKWCDLVPAYFEDYFIVRDPGYNVASWNIDKRRASKSEKGEFQIDDRYTLRFFHFTGYDSGAGDAMTQRYSGGNKTIDEIWDWYGKELQKNEQSTMGYFKNFYNYYDNGVEIPIGARHVYRQRIDLQKAFPNPYISEGDIGRYPGGFYRWYLNENPMISTQVGYISFLKSRMPQNSKLRRFYSALKNFFHRLGFKL